MPEFTSKMQYKNYEKGEFCDERPRTLDEVVNLLQTFPTVYKEDSGDDPNDPCIVLLDKKGNYLKIDVYLGNMFCLHYISFRNEYYVYDVISFELAAKKLKEFFAEKLDLGDFEKKPFSAEIKSYFLTNPFEYQIRFSKVLGLSNGWIIYFVAALGAAIYIAMKNPISVVMPILIFLGLIICLIGCLLSHVFSNYAKKKNQYLKISRGSDSFLFGNTAIDIYTYHKNDIAEVKHYALRNSRSPNNFELFEIIFKDSTVLKFSNSLISGSQFVAKWRFPITEARKNAITLTWLA